MRMWEDKWFNEDQWEKPFTPKPENYPIHKVSELKNQSRGGWNTDLISEMFFEEEAQVILKIPLSSKGAKDRLVWMSIKNGQYSVLSGYKAEQARRKQARRDERTSNSRVEEERKMWKKV